ncbi:MAG: phosphoribosylanthranilate isomerase [Pseudomonadota bacterium]
MIRVKLCGLRTVTDVTAAAEAGATYIGLVFYPKSPRYVTHAQARELALAAPVGLAKVALVVNPTDAELDALLAEVPIDMIQLHGSEPPERVSEVRARTGLPVMKAIGIAEGADLAAVDTYAGVADQLLLDTKPPKDASLPGGNGLSFDWTLLNGRRWPVPWMLAGGLRLDNVAEAVRISGTRQVDLSSGLESAPGIKDATRFRPFIEAAQAT